MDKTRMGEIAWLILKNELKENVISAEGISKGVEEISGQLPGVSKEELTEFGVKIALEALKEKESDIRGLIKE